jgi:transcriptional regulator of arginine metabolism
MASTEAHGQQQLRRAALARILRERAVGRQSELVRLLRREGFEATQSSVSRDLRELGVAKAGDRYLLPATEDAPAQEQFDALRAFVREVRAAGNSLTVVRTSAGDDTIFVATDGARAQRALLERLRTTFGR